MNQPLNQEIKHIKEPLLEFASGQTLEDPRMGLTVFGPFEKKASEIRIGIIGTKVGIDNFKKFLEELKNPSQFANTLDVGRPYFAGIENIFQINIASTIEEVIIPEEEISDRLYVNNVFERTHNTVDLFINYLDEYRASEESINTDIWFIVVPDEVKKNCSPLSKPYPTKGVSYKKSALPSKAKAVKLIKSDPLLSNTDYNDIKVYDFYPNFHHQLKARLLSKHLTTQIVRENLVSDLIKEIEFKPKLTPDLTLRQIQTKKNFAERKKNEAISYKHHILWQLASAIFYKLGNRPWKLSNIRPGVCYIGLVYKKYESLVDYGNAVCAAQMFLDDGDGMVFKSNGKPLFNKRTKEYHLKSDDAYDLIAQAIKSYQNKHGKAPTELFIHSRTQFNEDEWNSFLEACPDETSLVGVTIKQYKILKLFRDGKFPVLRGTFWQVDENRAYLWPTGFIPPLHTTNSLEVPNPLEIIVTGGSSNLETIASDILGLTKLNYNACLYGDGRPITLKFSEYVGELLTSVPSKEEIPPLHFKYYL